MPDYSAPDDAMDESYRGDTAAPEVTPPEGGDTKGGEETVDEQAAASNTAIVPNKILSPKGQPLKEGDEIVVRVVKNHGETCEIEYAEPEGGGTEESPSTAKPGVEEATTPGNEEAELAALSGE